MSTFAVKADTDSVGSMENRRKFPRLNVRRTVTIGVDGREFLLATVNLSFGGAFIDTDLKVAVGKVISFSLDLDGQRVTSDARVVHQGGEGLALSFVKSPEDFVKGLCRVVNERVSRDASMGASEDEVPARVALLVSEDRGYSVVFSSSLSQDGMWVIAQRTRPVETRLWLTLPEHGLFDSEAQVVWSDDEAMRLQFVEPSKEFSRAYRRVLDSFTG